MGSESKRPREASYSGWIAVALGVWALISGVGGAIGYAVVGAPDIPSMRWVWAHYGEVTLAQVGLGAVTIACGGGVLKRLRVARHATQAVMASWVMLLVGSGVWLATVHPLEDLGFAGAVFDVFWGLTAIGSMLMWSLLPVVALRFLRKPAVRHWFDERKAG